MKKIFDNKILLIILLVSILILTSISNVFANEITINDNIYSTSSYIDNYYFFIVTSDNGQHYSIYYSSEPLTFDSITAGYDDNYIRGFTDTEIYFYGSFSNLSELADLSTYVLNRTNEPFRPDGNCVVVYSSFDLYDSQNNLVFQTPELVPEITKTLVETVTQEEMDKTILATIKTYLIYLVIFVVSIIAIWKAIKFLRSVLKAS